MSNHPSHGEPPTRDDDRRLWRRTLEALLAEGATMLDAIEGATLVVYTRRGDREGGTAQPAADGPRSGVRDAGAEPWSGDELLRSAG